MLQFCARRMLRRICGVSLADKSSSGEILESCKLKDLEVLLKKKRLFWLGHIKRRSENKPLTNIREEDVPGRRPRGRPKKLCQVLTDARNPKNVSQLTSSREGTRRRRTKNQVSIGVVLGFRLKFPHQKCTVMAKR